MKWLPVLVFVMVTGCATPAARGPYQTPPLADRDSERARMLAAEAADLMASDPARAQAILEDALAADLYHGPAHNNLGVLHLEAGRLYEAAQEFQWAARLMPGHPDPRMNLALTFERVGRVDDAIEHYERALAVFPGHTPTTQALVRCQLRYGRTDDSTRAMLEEIALAGETEEWREMARRRLLSTERVD